MILTFLAVFSIEAGVFTVTDIAAYSSCHTHATIFTWKRATRILWNTQKKTKTKII